MDVDVHKAVRARRLHALSWTLSVVAFVAGFIVGMRIHAQLGAALWIASAVLALLPFASHRDRV
jgi:hypothetical protein